MSLKIVHISDTHGAKHHSKLVIPECDVLIHSGDIGGRTSVPEVAEFLIWFEKQPARKKIFVAGNHDICLDRKWSANLRSQNRSIEAMLASQANRDSLDLIKNYDVTYLCDEEYVWEGVKFYGSPYSPSFHRQHWAFNADRGQEIQKIWSKIPSDVNVLITHGPPYKILDHVDDKYREKVGEDMNVGCKDLLDVIKKRLFHLKLHCFGHIHSQYGIILNSISNSRTCLFSNGAVLDNDYNMLIKNPLIINLEI